MIDDKKMKMISTLTGVNDTELLQAFLSIAKDKILRRMYPFKDSTEEEEVPSKYENLQCEIATYLLNKRGAEGQIQHSENGINRVYESSDVPMSMLRQVVPYCEVIKDEVPTTK